MKFIDPKFIEYATKIREDAELKIVQHDEELQYIVSTPIFENFESFIELSKQYPVFEPQGINNYNWLLKQYFYPQHLISISNFLDNQFSKLFKKSEFKISQSTNFANLYHNLSNFMCPLRSCFPHVDSHKNDRIAVNFWISANDNDATSLWKVKNDYFYNNVSGDYIDLKLEEYAKLNRISVKPNEPTNFFNLNDFLEIKKVLDIPSIPNTLSIYYSDTWHTPKVDAQGENLRWSYVFFYNIHEQNSISI